jgi:hypothetical protein
MFPFDHQTADYTLLPVRLLSQQGKGIWFQRLKGDGGRKSGKQD